VMQDGDPLNKLTVFNGYKSYVPNPSLMGGLILGDFGHPVKAQL
jgi:hypothetical protein